MELDTPLLPTFGEDDFGNCGPLQYLELDT